MKKLNEREKSIKRGYLDCLNGKQNSLACFINTAANGILKKWREPGNF